MGRRMNRDKNQHRSPLCRALLIPRVPTTHPARSLSLYIPDLPLLAFYLTCSSPARVAKKSERSRVSKNKIRQKAKEKNGKKRKKFGQKPKNSRIQKKKNTCLLYYTRCHSTPPRNQTRQTDRPIDPASPVGGVELGRSTTGYVILPVHYWVLLLSSSVPASIPTGKEETSTIPPIILSSKIYRQMLLQPVLYTSKYIARTRHTFHQTPYLPEERTSAATARPTPNATTPQQARVLTHTIPSFPPP